MGLFGNKPEPAAKKPAPIDETSDGVQKFFDGYFQDLRVRGQAHFEKMLEESSDAFKKDLDATITKASTEIQAHITNRIDTQLAENDKLLKESQDAALRALNSSVQTFQQHYKELGESLEKNVADQQAALARVFDANNGDVATMKQAQDAALQALQTNVQAIQQEQAQINELLTKTVAAEKDLLVGAFEQNMAAIIEHYLLGALGDQYDLKSQLPSIIKQMEANKQAIADDMKL